MFTSIWILNEKGGTGKTTVAAAFVDHLIASGAGHRIIDADTQPDRKAKSSLSAFFPTAERIDIGVAPDQLMAKPSLAVAHWDGLFELARSGNTLADFGANVAESLVYWLDESDIGSRLAKADISLDLVIVTTAHPDAVGDALSIVNRLREALPPGSRRLFVALNAAVGDFDSYADSAEMTAFADLVDAGELTLVVVPKCGSEIWRDVERHRITPLAAAAMSAEDLANRLGTPELETIRGRKALAKWHKAVVDGFQEAGLLPADRASA